MAHMNDLDDLQKRIVVPDHPLCQRLAPRDLDNLREKIFNPDCSHCNGLIQTGVI